MRARTPDRDEGWAKDNARYWERDYRGFLKFFFSQIQLGIPFASDTEEAEVDQPDSAGGYPAPVEAAAA
jgi:hypothetical protein